MDEFGSCLLVCLLGGVVTLFGVAAGARTQQELDRDVLIQAGVAEWRIDPETGDRRCVLTKVRAVR